MELSTLVERLIDDPRLRADLEALLAANRAGQELDRTFVEILREINGETPQALGLP